MRGERIHPRSNFCDFQTCIKTSTIDISTRRFLQYQGYLEQVATLLFFEKNTNSENFDFFFSTFSEYLFKKCNVSE